MATWIGAIAGDVLEFDNWMSRNKTLDELRVIETVVVLMTAKNASFVENIFHTAFN